MDKKNVQKLDDEMLENVNGGIYHYNPSFAILNSDTPKPQAGNALMDDNVQVESRLVGSDVRAQLRTANNVPRTGNGSGFNPTGGTFV